MADAKGFKPDVDVRVKEYRIGAIGAGMIMAECHLAAYREAGFPVVAITSRRSRPGACWSGPPTRPSSSATFRVD